MPIVDAKKRRIGRELVDWIHLGIRTGARHSVAQYRAEKERSVQALADSNPSLAAASLTRAINQLTRAVNMPRRARERINEWIRVYDLENGAGSGQTFIVECLALAGSVTLGDINSDLTTLENQTANLIATNAGGGTLDEMATAIENALDNEAKEWQFPIPEGYTDIGLLDN